MSRKKIHEKKWRVVNGCLVADWDNNIICACWDTDSEIWDKRSPTQDEIHDLEANAHCLAKSPEMLKLLKDILSKLERGKRVSKAALRSIINDAEYGERNG